MAFKKLFKKMNLTALKEAFSMFRSRYFTIPAPGTPAFSLDNVRAEEIEKELGRVGYHRDKELSYNYEGEVLNMARYYYDGRCDNPWRQVHVRAIRDVGGTLLFYCHEEPTPSDHPEAHYEETETRYGLGVRLVREDLETCGYQV